MNDKVMEAIEIIQDSCLECKYSCWYKEDYDLDACELNKEMKEIHLNTSVVGDKCPLPNLIKQHIINQQEEIEKFKEYIFLEELLSCDWSHRREYYKINDNANVHKDNIRLKELEKELNTLELRQILKEAQNVKN